MDLFPEHPGIELRNIIKQKNMNISEFARMIDVSPSRINEIVHTKRSITLDTAMRLAKVLNTTTKYWMEITKAHQLQTALHNLAAKLCNISRSYHIMDCPEILFTAIRRLV